MINFRRRLDRRAWITRLLPADLPITFTSDWTGPFDGHELYRADLEVAGYKLFPWQIDADNPWWSRPLKYGEIGCALAHLACWREAARTGTEPFILVLEDDAIFTPTFIDDLLSGLLSTHFEHALMPIDEFLPSLYIDHPRADLRARFPRQLTALAFDPPLVLQRPKDEAGSDTEDSAFVDP